MKKWKPLRLLSAISLLLCVVMTTLWARSYRVSDAITYGSATSKLGLQSATGSIVLVTVNTPLPIQDRATDAGSIRSDDNVRESFVNWAGLHYQSAAVPFVSPRTEFLPDVVYPLASMSLVVPFWAVVAMLAIAPLCRFVRLRDRWT
jgi:hypothetical protein